ncbi:hypothetical protein [Thalassotalea mangrovi]|uniref:Helix-turn-helix domain-containing protein n=1 Tax=Thalassotalea mangrovi TaxID=2572245 RepID=A0A4U1B2P9_9GAMM|nr:hypothetical protein [Thalassotalea mangrovi]TKB43542.1 hypothetical protein E8M12_14695 [Thalassotalea mangrovi]
MLFLKNQKILNGVQNALEAHFSLLFPMERIVKGNRKKNFQFFDSPQASGIMSSFGNGGGSNPMANLQKLSQFDTSMQVAEAIHWFQERLVAMENELAALKQVQSEGWMSLEQAAALLGKSVAAVRQRLKHEKKPMPEGKVWKQQGKGCAIYVHLSNYKKYM